VDEDDYRAGGLVHDLLDQFKRVLGALAEPHQGDVGSLPGGHRPHVSDFDLAGDHLVPQPGDDRCDQGQAISPLVGDQHAQMFGLAIAHRAVEPARVAAGSLFGRFP
jgi:hypothetical protein